MYCTNCNCEYQGWHGKCPTCRQPMQDGKPLEQDRINGHLEYSSLVELIKQEGGALEMELSAREVIRNKSTRFPWLGFGYAWTQKMSGEIAGIHVELTTTDVGKDRSWAFPYRGHGYAWQQAMEGWISGNTCNLEASKVTRKRSYSFPYSGYGFAWTEEMNGDCGEQIRLLLTASQVVRKQRWVFPYFGFGYAWVDEGVLSIKLI